MVRPNLFRYATSELSQDAVLCWLAEWASPGNAELDGGLHALGTSFIATLFGSDGRPVPKIDTLHVQRQVGRIDVLLVINGSTAVCIEDKVGTTEHSRQLERYLERLELEYDRKDIVPVYIQTFEQSSYRGVEDVGYRVVARSELLRILRPYATSPGADSIARDYHDRLEEIDREVRSFERLPLDAWSGLAWQGFYGELQQRLNDGEWAYVPNPSGGFEGFWWHVRSGCGLQLEQERLAFKMWFDGPEHGVATPDAWLAQVLAAGCAAGLPVERPGRMRKGQSMTVAVLRDYRAVDGRGVLDLERTVARLRQVQTVFDVAIESCLAQGSPRAAPDASAQP